MSVPRYNSYQPSGFDWLGDLPSHWQALPNKVAFQRIKTEVGNEWSKTQLLSLTLRGVVTRNIDSGEGKYPSDFSNYQIVEPNDLVMCLFDIDETPRTVGLSSSRGMITSAYDVFRCNETVDPNFVHYFYRHIDSHKGLRPFYTGLRKTVRMPTFLSIKMPVPPIDEQKAIAKFLDSETSKIDSLVTDQRQLIELLKEKRQAVISHAVTKGLSPNAPMKPSGTQWLGDVPEHWTPMTVRNLIRQGVLWIQDGNHGESHPKAAEFKSSGIPFLMAADMDNGAVDLENCNFITEERAAGLRIDPATAGDVLLSHKGNQLGGVAVIPNQIPFPFVVLTPQITYYRIQQPILEPRFLSFVLQSGPFQNQLWFFASIQATRPYVGLTAQRDLWFAMPPMNEQEKIVESLSCEVGRFDTLLAEAERAIELLQERRTALISAAVTGKIDVRGFQEQEVA